MSRSVSCYAPVNGRFVGHRFTAVLLTALAVALAVALAACGSTTTTKQRPIPTAPSPTGEAAKSAATIIADARRQLLAARSVHVTGSFTGSSSAPGSQRIDLHLGRGARGVPVATGTVTTTTTTAGKTTSVTLALIRVGNVLYLRGDRTYYSRIGRKAAAVAGRWLSLPLSQDRAVADVTDLVRLASGLTGTSGAKTLGLTQFGAQRALLVRSSAGAYLYVASSGPPRLLRLQRPAGSTGLAGRLDFGSYDAALTVKAPAGAVALATVQG